MERGQLLLHLAHMPGNQNDKIIAVLNKNNGVDRLLGATLAQLRQMGLTENNANYIATINGSLPQETLSWLDQDEQDFIDYYDRRYPPLLREIVGAPFGLFVKGNAWALGLPQIAIVGSRKATPGSKAFTHQLAGDLVKAGFVVSSGLAQGIDAMAHQGALKAHSAHTHSPHRSEACTLAVLGHGLHLIYPRRHQQLAAAIAGSGALVSEFAPGVPVMPHHFPRRNRIISGMSQACVVVEAAIKSGSLITAQCALEQNREVFAVPGAVGNRMARGSNQLLKEGATLIENAQDILDHFNGFQSRCISNNETEELKTDEDFGSLLSHIGYEVASFDALLGLSGLTVEALNSDLLALELAGKITCVAGGYIRSC